MVDALRCRPEGARLALVVEGGGMRGAVSGGMALGLDELGLADAFDAAYGASAGTLNALWLLSGRIRDGMPTWTDSRLNRELISWRRIFGRRPIVDVGQLVENRYERLSPGIFRSVLASRTEFHPIATEVATGNPVDLGSQVRDEASLRRAIRASAALPILSGSPVVVGGVPYLDAGLSAAIPFRAAFAGGATHVLILRSRRQGEVTKEPAGLSAKATKRMLSRIDPAVARAFAYRAEREIAEEQVLAEHDQDPLKTPHVLSVRPAAGSPVPGRLETNLELVSAALEAGREALHSALVGARAES